MRDFENHKHRLERSLGLSDGYGDKDVFNLIYAGNKQAEELIVFRRMNLVVAQATKFIRAHETNHNINIQALISIGYEKLVEKIPLWCAMGSTHSKAYLTRALRTAFKRHIRYIKDHSIKAGNIRTVNWLDEPNYNKDGEFKGWSSDDYEDGCQI